MKNRVPKTINWNLSVLHHNLCYYIRKWLKNGGYQYMYCDSSAEREYILKMRPQELISWFCDCVCDEWYGSEGDREREPFGVLQRAAASAHFHWEGMGRSRLGFSTFWYGKEVAIKVDHGGSGSRNGNCDEFFFAKKVKGTWAENYCLLPKMQWKNRQWGKVLMFDHALIIPNGPTEPYMLKKELPMKEVSVKLVRQRLYAIGRLTCDAHGFNIGWKNGIPFLIDYDFNHGLVNREEPIYE